MTVGATTVHESRETGSHNILTVDSLTECSQQHFLSESGKLFGEYVLVTSRQVEQRDRDSLGRYATILTRHRLQLRDSGQLSVTKVQEKHLSLSTTQLIVLH